MSSAGSASSARSASSAFDNVVHSHMHQPNPGTAKAVPYEDYFGIANATYIPPDSGGVFGRDRPPPAGTTMN